MSRSAENSGPYRKPWHGRLVEAVGSRLMRWGVPLAGLSEPSLLRDARREARLEDFGEDDFLVPLRILLGDLENDRNLGFVGRLAARRTILDGLVNRLRIQESWSRHPAIAEVAVRDPVFVVGMPRTGTTLLHNLLAQDPSGRAPQLWELSHPWPLAEPRSDRPDPRVRQTQRRVEMLIRASPQSAAIHEFHAEEPEECHHLFRNSMASQAFKVLSDLPGFSRWKLEHDMLAEYRYYKRQLQMLLWQRPAGHLVLKFPGHAWHLDALCEVFPDARVVMTHRDPVEVVGSFCSMVAAVRVSVSRRLDPVGLGRLLTDEIETGVRRMTAWRDGAAPASHCDVRYEDLVRDPFATVRGIYRRIDMPYREPMHSRMAQWLEKHRQHRHGRHVYRLADYGLDAESLGKRFAFYWQRFGDAVQSAT